MSHQAAQALVFIDANVSDLDHLINGVRPGYIAYALSPSRDGIAQITDLLNTLPAAPREIHLIAHGTPGALYLGNTILSLDTVSHYAAQIQTWFPFSASQSLYLYGCNVAAGDAGAEFLTKLHALTGANLAASTSRVGHRAQGGSWHLDVAIGNIVTTAALTPTAQHTYTGIFLPPVDIALSATDLDENVLPNSLVGTLSGGGIGPIAYSLVPGSGNQSKLFTLVNDELRLIGSPDFEARSSYNILVRATDSTSVVTETPFIIAINDLTTYTATGTPANETFNATNEVDLIEAGGGDDRINATVANLQSGDRFDGGSEVDTFWLTNGALGSSVVIDLSQTNQLVSLTGITGVEIANMERVDISRFQGTGTLTGDAGANRLTGGAGNDTLSGGDGIDILYGRGGLDTLFGDVGNDILVTGPADLVSGEIFSGGIGNDIFKMIFGASTDSVIIDLNIQTGQNILGNNVTLSSIESVDLSEFQGAGTVTGTGGANVLTGGKGKDTLTGGNGNDSLVGGAGNDRLVGGNGADSYRGGTGNDDLNLGRDSNKDTVFYGLGDGTDSVSSFAKGAGGDLVVFEGIAAVDVRTAGTATEFRLGNGVVGDSGFGSGQLLVRLNNVTGFTAADIDVHFTGATFDFNTP